MTTLRCEDFTLTVEEPVKQLGAKRLADGSVVFACEHDGGPAGARGNLRTEAGRMSIVVCGIDPSLTGTALVWGTSPTDFSHERFSSKPLGDDLRDRMKRLEGLVGRVDQLLAKSQPALILIEGYSFGSKCNRELLGEYGGCLRWHIVDRAPDVLEVQPTSLKKFITGSGAGKKDMVAAHVTHRWGVMFKDSDTYDAFGLFMMALAIVGQVKATTTEQRESVAKVIGTRRLSFVPAAADEPSLF